MATLVLMRHGETVFNAENRLTGTADVELTGLGRSQARSMACHIDGIEFQATYVSSLSRTQQTLDEVLSLFPRGDMSILVTDDLNERDCGDFNCKVKKDVAAIIGRDQFQRLDSDWEYKPPGGESMADLRRRLVPFFAKTVLPQLQAGRNILIVSSYNPIRILKWYMQDLTEDEIGSVKAGNAEVCICTITRKGFKFNEFVGGSNGE